MQALATYFNLDDRLGISQRKSIRMISAIYYIALFSLGLQKLQGGVYVCESTKKILLSFRIIPRIHSTSYFHESNFHPGKCLAFGQP
jgi:hypothetical protein